MKFAFAVSLFFALATLIAASAIGPNAERMRRGLPPLAPRTLYSPSAVNAAKRASPSGTPTSCSTGPIQCCDSVVASNNPLAQLVATALGIVGLLIPNIDVGLTCSSLSGVGVGGNTCSAHPVCCENNSFNGLIAIGCVPISISL